MTAIKREYIIFELFKRTTKVQLGATNVAATITCSRVKFAIHKVWSSF